MCIIHDAKILFANRKYFAEYILTLILGNGNNNFLHKTIFWIHKTMAVS